MNPPLYRTIDIYLASFLLCQGARLVSYEKVRPKRTEFRFVASEDLHHQLRLYWNRQPLLIVPFKLLLSLYRLKCLAIALGRSNPAGGVSVSYPALAVSMPGTAPGSAAPAVSLRSPATTMAAGNDVQETPQEGIDQRRPEGPNDFSQRFPC